MQEKRLVTAALPYINNIPHLGHIVGCHLPADVFARYCRLRGYNTLFIGGTDENGSTSEIAAEEAGIDLEVFSDKLYEIHKRIYDWFGISYDIFSRTSKKTHHRTAREIFKKIYEKGFITKGKIKVFYSPKEGKFLPDRYVKGACPKCGYEDATGDQCEKCTAVYDITELKNPRSVISGERVEIREAEHLFLRLDKLESKLRKWVKEQKTWRSQVRSIAMGWIKEGLKPRCITRDLRHGVKVPIKGFEDKVIYVWFEAPIGYLSFTKELTNRWAEFWKDKDSKIYHFLGKDNIPFHTIFWPAIIMADGNLVLPYNVVGLQYLNYEGGKFSKSKKRGVFCEKLMETGIDPDIMRAYLITVLPEKADTEFKWLDFQRTINSELIGNLGNFVNRSVSFVRNKLGGVVKKPERMTERDKKLENVIKRKVKKIEKYLEDCQLKNAFKEVLELSGEGNKYFDDEKPWGSVKDNKGKAEKTLYFCMELCRYLGILSAPFVPGAAKKIWEQLGLDIEKDGSWDSLTKSFDKYEIKKSEILFKKIDDSELERLKEITSNAPDLKELFE
jgi:methionyl-tRNA synthetase